MHISPNKTLTKTLLNSRDTCCSSSAMDALAFHESPCGSIDAVNFSSSPFRATYTYVCVYIYFRLYTQTHTHTHTHTYTYIHTYTHTHTHTHTHRHPHSFEALLRPVRERLQDHPFIAQQRQPSFHLCVCVCVCAFIAQQRRPPLTHT